MPHFPNERIQFSPTAINAASRLGWINPTIHLGRDLRAYRQLGTLHRPMRQNPTVYNADCKTVSIHCSGRRGYPRHKLGTVQQGGISPSSEGRTNGSTAKRQLKPSVLSYSSWQFIVARWTHQSNQNDQTVAADFWHQVKLLVNTQSQQLEALALR